MSPRSLVVFAWCALVCLLAVGPAQAFQQRQEPSRFDPLVIHDPSGRAGVATRSVDGIAPGNPLRDGWQRFRAEHGAGWKIMLDGRSGAPMLAQGPGIPWISPDGRTLIDGSAVTLANLERSLRRFAAANRDLLLAGDAELVLNRAASGPLTREVWQVIFDRTVDGIPVAGDRYVFHIGHGRLVSFGAARWSRILSGGQPGLSKGEAYARLSGYMGLDGTETLEILDAGSLRYLPLGAQPGGAEAPWEGPIGQGYDSALAWTFSLRVAGEPGTWVGMVDAHSGSILALFDSNHYALAKGGVYPESSDQICPSGCEQPGYPMSFADIDIGGAGMTAGSMGLFECTPAFSTATTTLNGPYVRVNDNCGAVSESVTCDNDLDLGVFSGADCAVAPGASPGNTHASRTSFYHLNRAAEHGRAWLPSNTWLQSKLTDNVNINSNCNAFWNGTVNFYTSGGGCRNTGEIAGVVLHEWGHGMDGNDGGGFDNPSEAYADIVEFLYDHTSCIGRGFRNTANCGGYGNACLNCTGIRDMDWDQRADHTPSTPQNFAQDNCGGGGGPCNREVHCEGYIGGEAIWDLAVRDLTAAGLDQDTAWQLTDKLWYLSRSGSGGDAYNCSLPNSDGCNANSWFNKLRNIDDDDGDLSNGTPHAEAIFAAFDRHNIACGSVSDPSNQNSSTCPVLTGTTLAGTAGSSSASLSWDAVADAASYNILRNDIGCSHSFTIVGSVPAPGTTFTDVDLADDFTVYYRVQGVGSNTACDGAVSNCVAVTPQPFAGSVALDRASFGCSVPVNITVRDANVGSSTTTVTIFSDSEPSPETVILTETAPGSSRFTGTISTTDDPAASDGLLSLTHGDTITAEYIDADDGEGGVNLLRQTTATADCVLPFISGVAETGVSDTQANIVWTTDKLTDSVLEWGPTIPPGNVSSQSALVASHAIPLSGLSQCTIYYYEVRSTDASGNTAIDDNGGQFHRFETLGDFGQGLQPCHEGQVTLDRPDYACSGEPVVIELIDIDLNADTGTVETAVVELTSGTETTPEVVVLTETGPNTSTFIGSILTDTGSPVPDGFLQAADGDLITAAYGDVDDGSGAAAVGYATAIADCAGPVFTNISFTDEPPFRAYVSWNTSEPATSKLEFGPTAALGGTASDGVLRTSHQLSITDLDECSLQYFKVSGTDARGNTTENDRGGLLYTFESGEVPGKVFLDGFETLTGWTLESEYEIGPPQGLGTNNPDPTEAYNGTSVLGMDLTGLGASQGNYENNMSFVGAISPQIDARNLSNVKLLFRRWLNHDPGQQDQARLEGLDRDWTLIWHNPQQSPTTESSWSLQSYDITSLAAGNNRFQLRFLTITDFFTTRSGWNIDDVIVKDADLPDARACGGCTNLPSFQGLSSATDLDACGDTGVALSWQEAASWGSGAGGTYAVYRDTTAGFTPSASNRLAAGIASTGYTDEAAANGTDFYYLVRAENDEDCSSGPNNGGVEDDNTITLRAGDSISQPVPPALGDTVLASGINSAHVRLSWDPIPQAASYRIYRADNPQMIDAVQIGSTTGSLFEDVGEMTGSADRFYQIRAVNACGVEGP